MLLDGVEQEALGNLGSKYLVPLDGLPTYEECRRACAAADKHLSKRNGRRRRRGWAYSGDSLGRETKA